MIALLVERMIWAGAVSVVALLLHQAWRFVADGHTRALLPVPTAAERWARAMVVDAEALGMVERDGVELISAEQTGGSWFVRRLEQDGHISVSERHIERVLARHYAPREAP